MRHFSILRNVSLNYNSFRNIVNKNVKLFSTSGAPPTNMMRLTVLSASVGAVIGIGYSGYTHYQVNKNRSRAISDTLVKPPVLKELPDFQPTRRVDVSNDSSNLKLVLFQYQTCPFCCKVRAFLDYKGISYDVVEVDAVLRQAIKWSPYKKVPILLAKTNEGYQPLQDSSVIISALTSYLMNTSEEVSTILSYYPTVRYIENDGSSKDEIPNKYFVMKKDAPLNELTILKDSEERKWRKWADNVLVHTLSPNVYRSLDEAYQAFNWFADVGMWREHFPKWEVSLMVNMGAVAMWMISKRLKRRHNLKEDVRQSLYDECNNWTKTLKLKNTPFMGGSEPNLSDLATYGILNSIEGCNAFADLKEHSSIGVWYDQMKEYVVNHRGVNVTS